MSELLKMSESAEKKRFAIWNVNGTEYQLKLGSAAIVALEEQLGYSLISVISSGIPKLKDMLSITYGAMKAMQPEIKLTDVWNLFDEYVEAGGSQTEFLATTFMDIYKVSGFFTGKQTENIAARQEKLAERL